MERIDELLLPTAALREALVNALCHRDYAIHGGAVNAAVYDDRTEIWSDGTLPFGLRPEDLKREHTSHPRNPFITDVFHRRGLIEQWGRGTQTIVELCLKAGHPEPEFGEQAGSVFVRLWPLPRKTTAQGTEQRTAQDRPKTGPRSAQGQPETLEQRILVVLASEPRSAAEIAASLNQKPGAGQFKVALRQLLNQGTIEYTIPEEPRSRWQRYRLTAKGLVGLADRNDRAVSIGALNEKAVQQAK